jgi:hypothetical protein
VYGIVQTLTKSTNLLTPLAAANEYNNALSARWYIIISIRITVYAYTTMHVYCLKLASSSDVLCEGCMNAQLCVQLATRATGSITQGVLIQLSIDQSLQTKHVHTATGVHMRTVASLEARLVLDAMLSTELHRTISRTVLLHVLAIA